MRPVLGGLMVGRSLGGSVLTVQFPRWVGASWGFLLVLSSVATAQQYGEARSLLVDAESSVDHTLLRWGVGATGTPQSEVQFGLLSATAGLGVSYQFAAGRSRWSLKAHMERGYVLGGQARDSDYAIHLNGNEEYQVETSRIAAEVTGTDSWSTTVALGWNREFGARDPSSSFSLWLGWERAEQSVRMQHGTFVYLSYLASLTDSTLPGLDSRYVGGWTGLWIAAEPHVRVERADVSVRAAITIAGHYDGMGTWNLRTNLAQPRSFEHEANGHGYAVEVGLARPLTGTLEARVTGRYVRRFAGDGPEQVFLADGTIRRNYRLREATFGTAGLALAIRKSF